ncbi:hypothetical protein FOL46_004418 [Perkinsus olseni]|uniref:Uncharacterized protein n=1 Tax=Perkinsus olseni TaxID=32597 RepID=A0A7J6MUP8_PEROL|nr:hypothetical protein FOL46_004418 [Perkinsus olseni]
MSRPPDALGSIYQGLESPRPNAILAALATMQTLDNREYHSGTSLSSSPTKQSSSSSTFDPNIKRQRSLSGDETAFSPTSATTIATVDPSTPSSSQRVDDGSDYLRFVLFPDTHQSDVPRQISLPLNTPRNRLFDDASPGRGSATSYETQLKALQAALAHQSRTTPDRFELHQPSRMLDLPIHRENSFNLPKPSPWGGMPVSPRMFYQTSSSSTATAEASAKPDGRQKSLPQDLTPAAVNQLDMEDIIIPQIRLGEAGRSRLKAILSQCLRSNPGLRPICNSIARLKSATVPQLLHMAGICGCMDKAMAIAQDYQQTRAAKSRKPRTPGGSRFNAVNLAPEGAQPDAVASSTELPSEHPEAVQQYPSNGDDESNRPQRW